MGSIAGESRATEGSAREGGAYERPLHKPVESRRAANSGTDHVGFRRLNTSGHRMAANEASYGVHRAYPVVSTEQRHSLNSQQ